MSILQELVKPYIDQWVTHPVRTLLAQKDIDLSYLLPDHKDKWTPQIPCPMVFNRIHITYNGHLSACCIDFNHDLLVADLNKISLEEAWNSVAFQKLRAAHETNHLEGTLCHACAMQAYQPYSPLIFKKPWRMCE